MRKYKHDLSYERALTCDMGELIPVGIQDVLPGDAFRHQTSLILRTTPLLTPILHSVDVKLSHFYVPYRQIWDDAEDFFTGGEDGTSTPTHPYVSLGSVTEGTLWDYLGIPPATYGTALEVNALYLRAYAHIYNEYYRDQDLVTKLTIDTTSGQDTTTASSVQNVAWAKDEFTAARPWEQRGTEVTVSLGDDAPISGIGKLNNTTWTSGPGTAYETDGSASTNYANYKASNATNAIIIEEDPNNAGYPNIRADLSAATGLSISDLRQSIGLQKFMERMARTGARYQEYLKGLGIMGDDLRLNNPLYLAGGRNTIQFSEVIATGSESGSTNVGDIAGHGIAAVQSNRYVKFFKEHGCIITLLSVRPKPMYTQAVSKNFLKTTKEDYYQPELARIGDRIIQNKEVYSEHSSPTGTFGYGPRYNEYRFNRNTVHGGFHSDYNDWHLGRIHSGDTALNQSFIECNPSKRVFAEQTKDALKVKCFHNVQARRMVIPKGEPGFGGL